MANCTVSNDVLSVLVEGLGLDGLGGGAYAMRCPSKAK